MPLPIDDNHIVMIERKGKMGFATPEDSIKFLRVVGETILENLDKMDCHNCRMKMSDCTCNNGEPIEDWGNTDNSNSEFDFVDWD